jgi:hypothetical protein
MQPNKTENTFSIDFFELMFLAESVIPPTPIARSMCFDDFSERHYHKMNADQRKQFLNHVKKCVGFSLDKDKCLHFYNRFNPENQFEVTAEFNGETSLTICYEHNNNYHVSLNRFVDKKYIKKIVRIYDGEVIYANT